MEAVAAEHREQARSAAATAAQHAAVRIGDVHDLEHLERMSRLFEEVWGREADAPAIMAPELLRAMEHAGNQVTAAFRGDEMVGATAALLGYEDGHVHVHSHVTGVITGTQGQGVGWALKQYQRSWCLDRGITTVRWTFDPLIRRNAVFNLVKLGARIAAFLEDVYGPMRDARNAGLPTDRAVASWELTERRVALASEGRALEPRLDALRHAGALEVLRDDGGEPVVADTDGRLVLARIPADIETMRAEDRERAARWAAAFRETVGSRIRGGYSVSGITRDGWYVLARDEQVEELAR